MALRIVFVTHVSQARCPKLKDLFSPQVSKSTRKQSALSSLVTLANIFHMVSSTYSEHDNKSKGNEVIKSLQSVYLSMHTMNFTIHCALATDNGYLDGQQKYREK